MKKVRTIRIDKELSDKLDSICVRHGDVSWHIENALRNYLPNKAGDSFPGKHLQEGHESVLKQFVEIKPKKVNPKKPSGFTPPTGNDVFLYLTEISVKKQIVLPDGEADRFVDFYESKGWMVGKNKMKDWKAAVRNWLRGKSNENNQRPNQPRRSSVVDRAHAAADERERARQARENDGPALAEIAGGVRTSAQQPIRGDDTGQLGTTLDGTYRRTD